MTTLYIFDFDDTLAMTDSHVVVTSVDGTIQRLDSRAFAKYRFQTGDDINFDEFTRAEGNLIQSVVNDMESAIEKVGLDSVFIVTARSLGKPVKEFLQKMGVTTPEVIATSGSEGKAIWLTRQLTLHAYSEVKVYEDCRKNIKMLRDITEAYNEEIGTEIKYNAVCIMPNGSLEIMEQFLLRNLVYKILSERIF